MILVVGGTGQLGFAVVRGLRAQGVDVSVLVRPGTDASAVEAEGARVVRGDLRDPASLAVAVAGADVVVATANSIVPRRGERADFHALTDGYLELGRRARAAAVGRFLFVSVPVELMHRGAIEFDEKERIEHGLRADGPPLTVVRASLFMETWLPAVGSRLALRGSRQATLDRGFWLTRIVGSTVQRSLDRFGIALLPGGRSARHAFVAVDDVAGVLVNVALSPDEPPAEILVGGPGVLDWHQVALAHARALGRPRVRAVRQPVLPFRVLARLCRRLSPGLSHLLAVQALVGTDDSGYPAHDAQRWLGRAPVSVEQFLAERAART